MSFSFNGNTPRKIIFNNQDVKKLIYNNDVVWEKKRLPVEYQEVEYIESTGTQYIDTNLLYVTNDRIEVDVAPVVITQDRVVFGSYISSAYVEFGILASKFRFDISDSATTPITENVRYKVVKDGATWTVDGNTITTSGSNKNTPYPIYLFGRCFNGTAQKMSKIKLYSYKQIRNNVTIADFIPCYRKIDKKPGLYDAFNDVFYTNDGTGEFNVGADIITIPTDYQRVEYIESTGTQYIDTGIVLNNGCVITLDFLIAESSVNRAIYGWRRKDSYTQPYQASVGANQRKLRYVAVGRSSANIQSCFNYDVRNKVLIDSVNEQVLVNNLVVDIGADFSNGKAFNENGSSVVHPYLFALNNAGTPLAISQDTRIYRYSVQYEGEVLQDLIPCYRKIDNAAGMYDVVNDVFYTNAGSGEFTVGADINELPSEYQRVEYIESSGTQYIQTSVTPNNNFRMDLKTYTTCGDSYYCAGVRASSKIWFGQTGTTTNNRVSASVNGSSVNASTDGVLWSRSTSGQTYEIMLCTNGDGTFTYHIKDLTNNKESLTENKEYTLMGEAINGVCLFALNRNYIVSGTNQVYYFRLYKNGKIAFDGIPCYRKSDEEIGLYDLVSKQFYTNQGTGTFTKGPDVN